MKFIGGKKSAISASTCIKEFILKHSKNSANVERDFTETIVDWKFAPKQNARRIQRAKSIKMNRLVINACVTLGTGLLMPVALKFAQMIIVIIRARVLSKTISLYVRVMVTMVVSVAS